MTAGINRKSFQQVIKQTYILLYIVYNNGSSIIVYNNIIFVKSLISVSSFVLRVPIDSTDHIASRRIVAICILCRLCVRVAVSRARFICVLIRVRRRVVMRRDADAEATDATVM